MALPRAQIRAVAEQRSEGRKLSRVFRSGGPPAPAERAPGARLRRCWAPLPGSGRCTAQEVRLSRLLPVHEWQGGQARSGKEPPEALRRCPALPVGEASASSECALCLDEFSVGEKVTRLFCFHAAGLSSVWLGPERFLGFRH